jgi:Cu/Ag efflux protein CusF
MALIPELGVVDQPDLEVKKATALFDAKIKLTMEAMTMRGLRKMRVSSLTDLILQNYCVKQIEDNKKQRF